MAFDNVLLFFEKNLPHLIFAAVVLLVAFIVLKVLRFSLNRFIQRSSKQIKVDSTQYQFLRNALGFVIYLTAFIIILTSIPGLKQLGATLFAGAGILAAIIGFASQAAFSNIVSGVFIVIFKPFRVGDMIKIGEHYFGHVEDITLRHTVIQDLENKRFIVPNTLINSEVIHNYQIGDQRVRNLIYFGIGYSVNMDQAMQIIKEEARDHPLCQDFRSKEDIQKGVPEVNVKVTEWAESAIILRATVWTNNPLEGIELKFDLLKSVKERFDASGMEIPFPHRTVYLRNDKPNT
jgi:small conductance mechanosensitive channel